MPYDEVLHKYQAGTLRSGSKTGPKVTSRKQAVAIMLSEKREAARKPEYRAAQKRSTKGSPSFTEAEIAKGYRAC